MLIFLGYLFGFKNSGWNACCGLIHMALPPSMTTKHCSLAKKIKDTEKMQYRELRDVQIKKNNALCLRITNSRGS